ncbi:hypothetical protein J6590_029623 [Homalodisca vitripennis]|nr:hypothetical protein J6590_029623 [Homalodisca vitripennis]
MEAAYITCRFSNTFTNRSVYEECGERLSSQSQLRTDHACKCRKHPDESESDGTATGDRVGEETGDTAPQCGPLLATLPLDDLRIIHALLIPIGGSGRKNLGERGGTRGDRYPSLHFSPAHNVKRKERSCCPRRAAPAARPQHCTARPITAETKSAEPAAGGGRRGASAYTSSSAQPSTRALLHPLNSFGLQSTSSRLGPCPETPRFASGDDSCRKGGGGGL